MTDVWTILSGGLFPLLGGAFVLLWNSLGAHKKEDAAAHLDIWQAINHLRGDSANHAKDLAGHRVDCERQFVKQGDVAKLEERLDVRLARLETKLDAAVDLFRKDRKGEL